MPTCEAVKATCKERLMALFDLHPGPLAAHEIGNAYEEMFGGFIGYSENCIATRLNDLERERRLVSRFREGKNFKEWYKPVFEGNQRVIV